MKNKDTAGILALFLGWAGIHRFYLGQTGLGVLYILLGFVTAFILPGLIGLIDAIVLLSMDKEQFDIKYNKDFYTTIPRDTDYDRRRYEYRQRRAARREGPDHQRQIQQKRPQPRVENPFKKSGVDKFKDFDYDAAIADFKKALDIDPDDVATHFNLACAYSLNERAEDALLHLDKAVALGFDDFDRIQNHDALAYLRIQPDFESFQANGYRINPMADQEEETEETNLLEQLKKLGRLREKGLLTEAEFAAQKKKLLSE